MSELTHGIDDDRFTDICIMAQSANVSTLQTALDYVGTKPPIEVYSGGYMLLSYFAKLVSDGSDSRFLASSVNSSSSIMSNDLSSLVSSDTYLWSYSPVFFADTKSSLSSLSADASTAMLASLGFTGSSFISDLGDEMFCGHNNGISFI